MLISLWILNFYSKGPTSILIKCSTAVIMVYLPWVLMRFGFCPPDDSKHLARLGAATHFGIFLLPSSCWKHFFSVPLQWRRRRRLFLNCAGAFRRRGWHLLWLTFWTECIWQNFDRLAPKWVVTRVRLRCTFEFFSQLVGREWCMLMIAGMDWGSWRPVLIFRGLMGCYENFLRNFFFKDDWWPPWPVWGRAGLRQN